MRAVPTVLFSKERSNAEQDNHRRAAVDQPRRQTRAVQARANINIAQQMPYTRQKVVAEDPDENCRQSIRREVTKQCGCTQVPLLILQAQLQYEDGTRDAKCQQHASNAMHDRRRRADRHGNLSEIKEYRAMAMQNDLDDMTKSCQVRGLAPCSNRFQKFDAYVDVDSRDADRNRITCRKRFD